MQRFIFGSLSVVLLSLFGLSVADAQDLQANNSPSDMVILAQNSAGRLAGYVNDGTPNGINKDQWLTASGELSVAAGSSNNYNVTLRASGLIPNGLYTFWWVNKKTVGMDMGPAGGIPGNEFRADSQGNAVKTISVPVNNNYQMLAIAYHADNQSHGQMPGEMGKVTFTHLMGNFPRFN